MSIIIGSISTPIILTGFGISLATVPVASPKISQVLFFCGWTFLKTGCQTSLMIPPLWVQKPVETYLYPQPCITRIFPEYLESNSFINLDPNIITGNFWPGGYLRWRNSSIVKPVLLIWALSKPGA